MCSALCLEAREKKAKAYHDGCNLIQGVLNSLIGLRDLLEKAGDDASLSADGLEKMPFPYEFAELIGLPPGKE